MVTPRSSFEPPPASRVDPPAGSGLTTAVVIALVIASLYVGKAVFVPIALSALLSFALAPPVRRLRRIGMPRTPSVLFVSTVAFGILIAVAGVISLQIADLAQRLPSYQQNIETKIDALRSAPPGGRMFDRAADMMRDLGRKIDEPDDAAPDVLTDEQGEPQSAPIAVEVHERPPTSLELLETVVGPLIGPLATAGIVIVLVIFMLLKREDLRDRLIRLVGSDDLTRTTTAIDDAAQRVGHYLLMQLVVNVTYGVPVAIGLWLIGVPNPILWGMLATILRFVPYIGPIIAASFPLLLSLAVDPGWTTFLWTASLFIVIELISNNAMEPWLYGVSTGLSPVAIIAAAIFWTWLWGPIGLLLSTPLTVCLVVLGRHVPQLRFFDVLFGSEPALTPAQNLYQRLLAGDPDEATEAAEDYVHAHPLSQYYEEVAMPALALAEEDRRRGVLVANHQSVVCDSAMTLIENLDDIADAYPDVEEEKTEAAEGSEDQPPAWRIPPDTAIAAQPVVLCAGARGSIDDAAAAILAQVLTIHGATVRLQTAEGLQSRQLPDLDLSGVGTVVLSYMNADSMAHARFLVRRLRKRLPDAEIIVAFWTLGDTASNGRDPLASTRADHISTALCETVLEVARRNPGVPAVEDVADGAMPAAGEAEAAAGDTATAKRRAS